MKNIVILFLILTGIIVSSAKSAEITKSTSGFTLTYKGPVKFADVAKFKKLFTSEVKVVKLTSNGGSSYAGYAIANLLAKRSDVVVQAVDYCASACGIMWLGAKKQAKSNVSSNIVGFHLAYIGDLKAIQDKQAKYGLNGLEYTWKNMTMKNMAKDAKLIDNPSAIPMYLHGTWKKGLMSYNMWYPTHAELQQLEGTYVSLPKEVKTVKLVDSTNWTTYFSNPSATTYYSNGVWKTTVKIVSHTSISKISAALYSGFPNKATSITVGTDKNNFKYTSVFAADAGANETVYITIYSKVKPSYVWVYNLTVNAWVYAPVS